MTPPDIEVSVRRSRNFAAGLIGFVLDAYLVHFSIIVSAGFASDPAAWGQLGDYAGGLLNLLIAFLAFYWLTQSILLQNAELAARRRLRNLRGRSKLWSTEVHV